MLHDTDLKTQIDRQDGCTGLSADVLACLPHIYAHTPAPQRGFGRYHKISREWTSIRTRLLIILVRASGMNVSCLGKGLMTSATSCSQTAQQPPQAAGISRPAPLPAARTALPAAAQHSTGTVQASWHELRTSCFSVPADRQSALQAWLCSPVCREDGCNSNRQAPALQERLCSHVLLKLSAGSQL